MNMNELYNKIQFKLNTRYTEEGQLLYDGFDMSGYNHSFYHNLGIMARFQDYLSPRSELRDPVVLFPMFWKGSAWIVRTDGTEISFLVIEDSGFYLKKTHIDSKDDGSWSSKSTAEIIFYIILNANPDIVKETD